MNCRVGLGGAGGGRIVKRHWLCQHRLSCQRSAAIAPGRKGNRFIEPSETNVRNGSYPLARYLYIYINKAPNQPLEPLTAAFLDRVLSAQGQDLVNHDGYLPLPPDTLRKTRTLLGLD